MSVKRAGPFAGEHPIAFSHRGGRLRWPENTLLAFRKSAELGYRCFETDLHLSADGVLMVFHDDTLDRTTEGSGAITGYTAAELATFDAAFRFGSNQGWPYRGQGITIPTLEEVVTALPKASFTLELKQAGLAGPLVRFIEKHDLWDRVMVGGYEDAWMKEVRRVSGGRVATSSPRHETLLFWLFSRVGMGASIEADALQVPVTHGNLTVVDRRFVRAAHRAGKQVHVWTVNEASEMHRLLDLGVDGLMSDVPDVLLDVLAERGSGGPHHPVGEQ
ncbi:MAG: glycerophosphodiester phosphodiesterase [Acidimicrobiia bacterium]